MQKYNLVFISMCIFWFMFFFISIVSSMSYTPFQLSDSVRSKVSAHALQGWGFFSKSPRDELYDVHILNEGNDQKVNWPNNIPSNFFGLSREGRAQGIESGTLYSQISSLETNECEGNIEECLREAKVAKEVVNNDNDPTLCGTVGFSFQKPIPWAWSDYYSKEDIESKVIKVEVECKTG
ncbi:SdpA family antimicrobial peptide system protein [Halobacillus locisalis]|uniref:SdpA family antimicrobial peptide system protein n=1 Tax=Halobacillus locisalis TaxID=220753 RepID=A0A838CVI5_9BACI|nr:SdpA family antimicrobial peptide system protein [Halobacillus locisalis]MBA2175829.1 SdpA family antimicrobial peptide system protein [Halobacillus locisalis]